MKNSFEKIVRRWWRGFLCLFGVFLAVYGLTLSIHGLELLAERLEWSLENSDAFTAFEFIYYVVATPFLVYMFVPRLAAELPKASDDSVTTTSPANGIHPA